MGSGLTIGKAARRAGVSIQTIRYYERRGLLFPDGRADSGYRVFSGEAVRKLKFIKNAQGLGFTLTEIGGLLRLRVGGRSRCGEVKRKAEAKLADVRAKLKGLKALETALGGLVQTCRRRAVTGSCPILAGLETEEGGGG